MNAIEEAYALANRGNRAAAVAMLETAGQGGDSDALVELALWYLQGRTVPRNLALTRQYFGAAADLGNDRARMIYLSLVANGTGGTPDWQSALAILDKVADEDAAARRQLELITAMDLNPSGDPRAIPQGKTISEHPHAELFAELLTQAECSYLIDAAIPRLQPAIVIDSATGRTIAHPVRTSDTAGFPWIAEIPFVHAINRRIAAASRTTVECGEPLQVLRYRPGQEYKPHHDALEAETNQRILTMLIYLNSDYEGGETHFLASNFKVKGHVGDALLFSNADKWGRPDPHAEHAGLPVTSGEKIIASRWIREKNGLDLFDPGRDRLT